MAGWAELAKAGSIKDADIAADAAVAMSKLALAIRNAEVAVGAAIVEAKLALAHGTQSLFDKVGADILTHKNIAAAHHTKTIDASELTAGILPLTRLQNIANAQIAAAAGIAGSKLNPALPNTIANLISDHDLTRHPLAIIPTMDDGHIPNLETLSYGAAFAVAQIPNLSANKITTDVLALARIPTIPLSTKVSEHDLTRHPLSIIPTMDDAHIPNLEGLSYGAAFAAAQIPLGLASRFVDGGADALAAPVALAAIPLHTADRHMTIVSDVLKHSNDEEKSTLSDTYVKIKEIKLNANLPACRLKFDLHAGTNETGYATVYKNDEAIGTEQSVVGTGYKTKSENFTDWVENDLIRIYAKCPESDINPACVKNMRIYYTEAAERTPPTNQDPE